MSETNEGRPKVAPSCSEAIAGLSTPSTNAKSFLSKENTFTKDEKGSIKDPVEDAKPEDEEIVYPTGLVLAAIVLALCLAVFLVALDQTIIATAIPRITDKFHSVKDIGWYGAVRSQFLHLYYVTYLILGLFFDVYFSTT
jgi:hypothetical protein